MVSGGLTDLYADLGGVKTKSFKFQMNFLLLHKHCSRIEWMDLLWLAPNIFWKQNFEQWRDMKFWIIGQVEDLKNYVNIN